MRIYIQERELLMCNRYLGADFLQVIISTIHVISRTCRVAAHFYEGNEPYSIITQDVYKNIYPHFQRSDSTAVNKLITIKLYKLAM
jgi:hypothetical protein